MCKQMVSNPYPSIWYPLNSGIIKNIMHSHCKISIQPLLIINIKNIRFYFVRPWHMKPFGLSSYNHFGIQLQGFFQNVLIILYKHFTVYIYISLIASYSQFLHYVYNPPFCTLWQLHGNAFLSSFFSLVLSLTSSVLNHGCNSKWCLPQSHEKWIQLQISLLRPRNKHFSRNRTQNWPLAVVVCVVGKATW